MNKEDFYYIEWYSNNNFYKGFIRKSYIQGVFQAPDKKAILDLGQSMSIKLEYSYEDVLIDLFNQ